MPLVSIVFYFREPIFYLNEQIAYTATIQAKVITHFVRHRKVMDESLRANGAISQDIYYRAIAVACLDAFLFAFCGISSIISSVLNLGFSLSDGTPFSFYAGWKKGHSDWTPQQVPYSRIATSGTHAAWSLSTLYINEWIPVVLGLSVFAMFGTTQEARRIYSYPFRPVINALERPHPRQNRHEISDIEFIPRPDLSFRGNVSQRFVSLNDMSKFAFLTKDMFDFSCRYTPVALSYNAQTTRSQEKA
jgi:hypothetical protein